MHRAIGMKTADLFCWSHSHRWCESSDSRR
jgi:hypothetical protein